jgi:hypothetical protein
VNRLQPCADYNKEEDDFYNSDFETPRVSILQIRDKLDCILDLIDVCSAALLAPERNDRKDMLNVANVLFFYVRQEIHQCNEDLKNV